MTSLDGLWRTTRAAAVLSLVTACAGVPEKTAWMNGVPPEDAQAIGRLVHQRTTAMILSYGREEDGFVAIHLHGKDGVDLFWVAQRAGKGWKLYERDCMDIELAPPNGAAVSGGRVSGR